MKKIKANDDRIVWSGVVSLQKTGNWVRPWRLPYKDADFHPEALMVRAGLPSGVRLRLATNSRNLDLHVEPMTQAGNLDLYVDGGELQTVDFNEGQKTVKFTALPPKMKTVEIWLHQTTPFKLSEIRIDSGSDIVKSEDRRPKWITYGSSISHCGAASSPSFIWPGVVARAKNLNLTSIGVGGQCHADPMIARLIRDMPADLISVKIGINIYGHGSLNIRSFQPAVIGTIATIREKHPEIPFIVCSPIFSPDRETKPNNCGLTLKVMRSEIQKAVQAFRKRGDKNLYYVNGLKLCGPELLKNLPDKLHPDGEGYKLLGENFLREVFDVHGVQV